MRVLILLMLALPAAAQEMPFPALFDVTGVAADDVLNVRRNPRATAAVVGTLPPDGTGVEVVRLSESGAWGLVNVDEGTGWTSMQFLDRRDGQGWGDLPVLGTCSGTEPFWSLTPDDGLFRTPDPEDDLALGPITLIPARGRSAPWGVFSGADPDGARGILSRRACFDGMSDREAGFQLDLILDDRAVYTGCCSLTR